MGALLWVVICFVQAKTLCMSGYMYFLAASFELTLW